MSFEQLPVDLGYDEDPISLDIEAILRAGHRAQRRRQLAMAGSGVAAAAVLAGVGVAAASSGSEHGSSGRVDRLKSESSHSPTPSPSSSAPTPSPSPGGSSDDLFVTHPERGRVETLSTAAGGWREVAYVDTAGQLCFGAWQPASSGPLTGSCSDSYRLLTSSPSVSIVMGFPLGRSERTVAYFGVVRGARDVALTNDGVTVRAAVSRASKASGNHVWCATLNGLDGQPRSGLRVAAEDSAGHTVASSPAGAAERESAARAERRAWAAARAARHREAHHH